MIKNILYITLLLAGVLFSQQRAIYIAVDDTTELKGQKGYNGATVYLKQLSSANTNGGGLFTVIDSAYAENASTSGYVKAHTTAGKQWKRIAADNNVLDVTWYGAFSDCTNATATTAAIENAIEGAKNISQSNGSIFIPGGKYLLNGSGVDCERGVPVRGAGMDATYLYVDGDPPGNMAHFGSTDIGSKYTGEDSVRNNYYLSDMTLVGTVPLDTTNTINYGHGGIYFAVSTIAAPPNEIVVERVRLLKCGLGIQPKTARLVRIEDCVIRNTDWVAITPVANEIIVRGCLIDSVSAGMECYAANRWFDGVDSTATIVFEGNTVKNFYYYGTKIYSYTDLVYTNNIIEGAKDIQAHGDYIGCHIRFDADYASGTDPNRTAIIANNSITNSGEDGISIDFGPTTGVVTESDSIIGHILVEGNIVNDNYKSGFSIEPENPKYVKSLVLRDNIMINNNRNNAFTGSLSINIRYVDSLLIENNTVRRDTASSLSTAHPINLYRSDYAIIKNNDFRTKYSSELSVWSDSISATTAKLINNEGLDVEDALYNYTNTTGYYQNSYVDTDGFWVGGYPSETGYLVKAETDTLWALKYDASGNVVDSLNIYPENNPTVYAIMYGVATDDTISVTGGSWSHLTDGSGTYFTLSQSGGCTESGDTLYVPKGVYIVSATVSMSTVTTGSAQVSMTIRTAAAGLSYFESADTLDRSYSTTKYINATSDDYPLWLSIKTNTGNNLVVSYAMLNAVLIKRD